MEYLIFLTVVLLVTGLCALVITSGSRHGAHARQLQHGKDARASDLQALRNRIGARSAAATPWGWPGHGSVRVRENGGEGLSDALERWVDALVARKRTVEEDPDYRLHAHESMRKLLEDRFGGGSPQAPESSAGSPAINGFAARKGRPDSKGKPRGMAGIKTPWGW